jgi:hypothetical protein
MRGLLLAMIVVESGCVMHGGATIGIRQSGRVAYGWQAGGGTFAELVAGQSYAGGHAFTYGAVHGWLPEHIDSTGQDDGTWGHREYHGGLTLGAGKGVHGGGAVFGIDGSGFAGDHFGEEANYGGVQLTAGFRVIDDELELYAAGEASMISYAPYSGAD